MRFRSVILKSFIRLGLSCLSLGMIFNSCNTIWMGEELCNQGLLLKFMYDYNMEYADAFSNKVDCVTLMVYDEQGRHLFTQSETSSVLKEEGYRMTIDLDPGNYQLVAYGGMACEESSFEFANPTTRALEYDDRVVKMKDSKAGTKLHDLFYGTVDVAVTDNSYDDVVLPLMKNTNNIRVILQQLNGEPVQVDDFQFLITDDNTLFSYDNSLIPAGGVSYAPWIKGQASTGTVTNGESTENDEIVVAFAEFSTSRLVTYNSPRLIIRRNDAATDVVNIPLNNYLMLLKSSQYSEMGRQEFLDRESDWSLIFFLDAYMSWISTHIVINDWVVRINRTEY